MIKVPNSIKNKLESYYKHTSKAESLRREVENWVKSTGIDTDIDNGDIKGEIITNIIIDTGLAGNIDEAIMLIQNEINS